MNWCVLGGVFTDCPNSCSCSRSRCQEFRFWEQWFFYDTPSPGSLHGLSRPRLTNQSFFVVELICLISGLQRFSKLAVILEISLSRNWHCSKPGFGGRGPRSRSEYERNPTARPGLPNVFGWVFSPQNYLYDGCCFATFWVQLSHTKTIFRMAACFEIFLVQFSHAKISLGWLFVS